LDPGHAAKIRDIHSIVVQYPRLNALLDDIWSCHQQSKLMPEPACLLVTGPAGAGKSTLISVYLSEFPAAELEERSNVKVFHAEIPAAVTIKGLVTKLLKRLGAPYPGRGNQIEQTIRLIDLLEQCGTELIIIDEFHHVIDQRTQKTIQDVANWIKSLINATKIPIILMGMPGSRVILTDDDQLKRRFSAKRSLDPFGWSTAERRTEYRTLLAQIDSALPFLERSELAHEDLAYPIFLSSGGKIAGTMKLITNAGIAAVLREAPRISVGDLEAAFEGQIGPSNFLPFNPFRSSKQQLQSVNIEKLQASHMDHRGKGQNQRVQGRGRPDKISDVFGG